MGAVLQHKRPHQGIGGLCLRIVILRSRELRKTIERGLRRMCWRWRCEEAAGTILHGRRMEGQSVVLRAEKGKLRLMVDDEEGGGTQEMVYELPLKQGSGVKGGRKMENAEKLKAEKPEPEEKRAGRVEAYGEEKCRRC